MFPYVALLAVPGWFALTGARRVGVLLLVVAFLYWLFIGFRFQVGMDWNNYIFIYEGKKNQSLAELLVTREPGYGLLTWIAERTGGNTIFLNVASGLAFCWGLFSFAKRCREPWLAIVAATPLLVIVFAMSGNRQSVACGIIFYIFATWDGRRTSSRIALILTATLFHFSAIFILTFVALASNARPIIKFGSVMLVSIFVLAVIRFVPDSMESYSRLYVGRESELRAPGAIVQVGVIAAAALLYLLNLKRWRWAYGDSPLHRNLAWASLCLMPAILISSVGAYRFALYLWPMAMYVWSGLPGLAAQLNGRAIMRLAIVAASFAMLFGWLLLGNNSLAWLPYQNWLFQSDDVTLIRRAEFQR